jgi:aminopeptidase
MGAIEDYARLVVRVGVDVRKGQDVYVSGDLEHADFLHAIAEDAYRAGARHVDIDFHDPWLRRALVAEGSDESLGWSPPWMVTRMEQAAATSAAVIHVSSGSDAEVYEGLDLGRLARARMPELEKAWLKAVTDRAVAWTIVAYPTERWAVETLGEPDVDRLWTAVAHVMRLDEPDPAAAWRARLDELETRARSLTERRFDAIRYRGPGTELEVGLIEDSRWMAGRERTTEGQTHVANMPTEEVFTSPHRMRADGTVRATMPFGLRGGIVEGLELRLAGGEIVEARASRGEDIVRAEIALDDGARRLGELALVDVSSRVGETGLIFRNTLFDENAASHIAWGAGLAWTVDGIPADEHEAAGLNDSQTHTDFMIGSPEVEIDGVERGGSTVPLLRDGVWHLAS